MWIFLNDAFLSIVAHESEHDLLHVRARLEGDIERVFPEAESFEMPQDLYRFHATLRRERVANILANEVRQIQAQEFQKSVDDPARRAAYAHVWDAMAAEERRRAGEA